MSNTSGLNYICFTTIPSRFKNLYTIISYIKKNFKGQFHNINIYIPNNYIRFGNKYKIPDNVLNIDKVNIVKCDTDWGPATKFIGPISDQTINNNDNIIVIDDDNIKDLNWLIISKYYLNKFPKSIVQLRISSYNNNPIKFKMIHIHGVSGFCFKKGTLNNDIFNKFISNIPKILLFIDDDILTYYSYLYKINIVMSNEIVRRKYLYQDNSLVKQSGNLKRSNLRKKAKQYLFNKYRLKFNFNNIA